jgi:uncharacterized RDD family membrane protein YckC
MEYAGLGRRITAHFLDILVLLVAMALIVFIGRRQQDVEIFLTLVRGALLFLYTLYFHGKTGQTLGKKWVGIRVAAEQGEKIGFVQSARRNSILFLMSIPWIVATVIALQRMPAAQYMSLWGHGEAALEASLRPGWFDQIQLYMLVVFAIDIVMMFTTKRRQSLHDYIGGTVVVMVEKDKSNQTP